MHRLENKNIISEQNTPHRHSTNIDKHHPVQKVNGQNIAKASSQNSSLNTSHASATALNAISASSSTEKNSRNSRQSSCNQSINSGLSNSFSVSSLASDTNLDNTRHSYIPPPKNSIVNNLQASLQNNNNKNNSNSQHNSHILSTNSNLLHKNRNTIQNTTRTYNTYNNSSKHNSTRQTSSHSSKPASDRRPIPSRRGTTQNCSSKYTFKLGRGDSEDEEETRFLVPKVSQSDQNLVGQSLSSLFKNIDRAVALSKLEAQTQVKGLF